MPLKEPRSGGSGGPPRGLLWSGSYGLCAKVNQFFKNLGAPAPPGSRSDHAPAGSSYSHGKRHQKQTILISLIHWIYLPQDTSGGNVITSPGDVRQDHSIHGGESRTQSAFRGVKKGGTESVHSSDIFLWMDSWLTRRNQGAIVSFWLVISSPVLIELDPTQHTKVQRIQELFQSMLKPGYCPGF